MGKFTLESFYVVFFHLFESYFCKEYHSFYFSDSTKKDQIEAVNLELVSMRPYAGANNIQTKSQEACEVPADSYEEYFVPVNEHRKYIR